MRGFGHAVSLPRRSRVRSVRGMARRKAQNPYGSCIRQDDAGAFRRANHGVFRQRALLSSGPSRIECADRSVSQLLAGTPSGPGGSSNAARVPRCDEARRRRTPSRLTTPHDSAPQVDEVGQYKRGFGGGECCAGDNSPTSRHPGGSRDPVGQEHTPPASAKCGSHPPLKGMERVAGSGKTTYARIPEFVVCSENANPLSHCGRAGNLPRRGA